MRTSRQPSPLQIMINQKQLEKVEYLKYLGGIVTNQARYTCDIKSRIGMAKAAFKKKKKKKKKKTLLNSKLDLDIRNKPEKCYIWNIVLYGAESWTLREVEQKYMESFEMWCWRRVEKISWTDRVGNEVLCRVKKEGTSYVQLKKER